MAKRGRKATDSADQYLENFSRTMKQSKNKADTAFARLSGRTQARFKHASDEAFKRLAGKTGVRERFERTNEEIVRGRKRARA